MLKTKNIIIFLGATVVLVLVYIFFVKPDTEQGGLISTSSIPTTTGATVNSSQNALDTKDFLVILLSVKNIKLDDSIFSDVAFSTLRDSSIILTPDGSEGRPNPFAPIGNDIFIFDRNTSNASLAPAGLTETNTSSPSVNTSTTIQVN